MPARAQAHPSRLAILWVGASQGLLVTAAEGPRTGLTPRCHLAQRLGWPLAPENLPKSPGRSSTDLVASNYTHLLRPGLEVRSPKIKVEPELPPPEPPGTVPAPHGAFCSFQRGSSGLPRPHHRESPSLPAPSAHCCPLSDAPRGHAPRAHGCTRVWRPAHGTDVKQVPARECPRCPLRTHPAALGPALASLPVFQGLGHANHSNKLMFPWPLTHG